MKPLSFKEWYERLHNCRIYYRYVSIEYVERYAQYRAKLAWDEAAKAQRDVCADCVPPSNYYFEAIKNAPLVEYKETL